MPVIQINVGGNAQASIAAIRSEINALIGEVGNLRGALASSTSQFQGIANTLSQVNVGDIASKMKPAVAEAGKFADGLRDVARASQIMLGPLSGVSSRFTSFISLATGTSALFATVAVGAIGLAFALYEVVKVGEQFEAEQFKLQGVLRATGEGAGYNLQQLNSLARSISETTLSSASDIRTAEGIVLAFTNVTGESFTRTIKIANDLARLGFGGIEQEARLVSKALQDPIDSLEALTRTLGKINPSDVFKIQAHAAGGDIGGAQAEIQSLLERRVGGAAEAEAQGLEGQFHRARVAVREFLEDVAVGGGILDNLSNRLKNLGEILGGMGNRTDFVRLTVNALNRELTVAFAILDAGAHAFVIISDAARVLSVEYNNTALASKSFAEKLQTLIDAFHAVTAAARDFLANNSFLQAGFDIWKSMFSTLSSTALGTKAIDDLKELYEIMKQLISPDIAIGVNAISTLFSNIANAISAAYEAAKDRVEFDLDISKGFTLPPLKIGISADEINKQIKEVQDHLTQVTGTQKNVAGMAALGGMSSYEAPAVLKALGEAIADDKQRLADLQKALTALPKTAGPDNIGIILAAADKFLPDIKKLQESRVELSNINAIVKNIDAVMKRLDLPQDLLTNTKEFVLGLATIATIKLGDEIEKQVRDIKLATDSTGEYARKQQDLIYISQANAQIERASLQERLRLTADLQLRQAELSQKLRPTLAGPIISTQNDATGRNRAAEEATAAARQINSDLLDKINNKQFELVRTQRESLDVLNLENQDLFKSTAQQAADLAVLQEKNKLSRDLLGMNDEQYEQLLRNASVNARLVELIKEQKQAMVDLKSEAGKLLDSFGQFMDTFGQKTKGGLKAQFDALFVSLSDDLKKFAFEVAIKNPLLNLIPGGQHATTLKDIAGIFTGQGQKDVKELALQENTTAIQMLSDSIRDLTGQIATSGASAAGAVGTGLPSSGGTVPAGGDTFMTQGMMDAGTGPVVDASQAASSGFFSGMWSKLTGMFGSGGALGASGAAGGGLGGMSTLGQLGLGAGIGGMLGGLLGNIFGGGKGAAIGGGLGSLAGLLAAFMFLEKGGVFDQGNVVPMALGEIYNRPHMFSMAGNRTGMMGEAGPEAAMPLIRTSSGHLGVRADMAPLDRSYVNRPRSMLVPTIQLDNRSNTPLRHEAQAEFDHEGSISKIKVVMHNLLEEDMSVRGKFSRNLEKNYNMQRRNRPS